MGGNPALEHSNDKTNGISQKRQTDLSEITKPNIQNRDSIIPRLHEFAESKLANAAGIAGSNFVCNRKVNKFRYK